MADLQLVERLRRGAAEWNRYVRERDVHFPRALSDGNLAGADLSGLDLRGVRLLSVDLGYANLRGANLATANLTGSRLERSCLAEANLENANLSHCYLGFADLSYASLRDADLSDAKLHATTLSGLDLRGAKGLDSVVHLGPSSLGIDTLYKCRGAMPEAFLRGCGVPDQAIEFARSLVGKALNYYSAFISYSTHDQDLASRIHRDLQAEGIRCWLASEDLKIGARFRNVIHESIRAYDKLLLLLSENSVVSPWVEEEVETAMERERRYRETVLFPVRLDVAVMKTEVAWAESIRNTRQIGDFTDWKNHDSYQRSFERLLRDLKNDGRLTRS